MVDSLVDRAQQLELSPRRAIAEVAERAARAHGATLRGLGLRITAISDRGDGSSTASDWPEFGTAMQAAALLGPVYERLINPIRRRRTGAHLTPVAVARNVVACLGPAWVEREAVRVLDPAVGGGVFLLAAADALVAAGHRPAAALASLYGVDLDPDAVAVSEAALNLWAIAHGLDPEPLASLDVGDGLLTELPAADVVIGNPPFLNQLRGVSAAAPERRSSLRDRWGSLVGPYTDESWLFIAAAVNAARPAGQVALVQPTSLLAARDSHGVRSLVHEVGRLAGLWVAGAPVFDAAVDVCAVVIDVGHGPSRRGTGRTRRWSGLDFVPEADEDVSEPSTWPRAAAPLAGIPSVHLSRRAGSVGDVAGATAGFRDQFYGFVDFMIDDGSAQPDSLVAAQPRLVTVGMIDPFHLRWGQASFRYAGRRVTSPVLDLEALAISEPALARWTEDRLRPKVLVATQTRIIEAWPDRSGGAVPITPVISIEPHDSNDVAALTVALAAPPIVADLAAAHFGSALSDRALKLAARNLLDVPLPVDRGAWRDAAALLAAFTEQDDTIDPAHRFAFGQCMSRAHGHRDDDVVEWWLARWPRRATARPG